jgi:hypothetical protein
MNLAFEVSVFMLLCDFYVPLNRSIWDVRRDSPPPKEAARFYRP